MKNQEYNDGSIVKEQMTREGFAGLINRIQTTFSNLKITDELMEDLFREFQPYRYKDLKSAVESLIHNNEAIKGGTNLIWMIKRHLPQDRDNRRVTGWICSRCEKVNPLDMMVCDCEKDLCLTYEQKKSTVDMLRKLGCKTVADSLEAKLGSKPEYNDNVPF